VPEPMLPLDLFQNRLIAVASLGNTLLGMILYSITAYVPMFSQGVLGGTAFDAGSILMPILIGWPISSTLAARIMMRIGFRPMSLAGNVLVVAGALFLGSADAGTTRLEIMAALFLMGFGLGFVSMPYLLGPQNAVPWNRRGVATSSVQFFRTMGGTLSVAIFGALLNARLAAAAGPGVTADSALDPAVRARLAPETLSRLTGALLEGLSAVFVGLVVLAVAGLAVSFFFPRGSVQSQVHPEGKRDQAPVIEL
ncbi:MAG: MFS transporter, partial [Thermoanaerobaculia bacterium]